MTEQPSYELEMKARDERTRLHSSVRELKRRLHVSLDLNRAAREHLASSCGAAALLSVVSGYALAAILSRSR